jgi:O-antigen/teichoic acid export membrane protein
MNDKASVKRNIVSNIVVFLLNAIIGIWLPPFLISRLGVGAYGLIPLATAIIGYVSLITVAINGSLARFLSMDIHSGDQDKASKTFNTASTSLGILFLFITPFLIWFCFNISRFISVPAGVESSATILFLCASAAFILSAFTSVFNTSGYIANRLDLVNRVSVINTYVRVILILFFFYLISVSLEKYGLSLLVASVISSGYSFYIFKKYTPFIKINIRKFDPAILKELLSMGWWLMVIQLGSILFLQVDLLVINKVLGSTEAGKYSVLLQWSNMIRTFAILLSGALGPIILNLYAKKQTEQIIKLAKLSNKLLTLAISCLVVTLCVFSKFLLAIWISPEFSTLNWLFIIMMLPLPLNLGVLPLFSLNRAYNKVKVPGILTCTMGFANFILAIFFVKYTSLGLYGVAVASGIVLTIKNFLFMPVYVAKNMGLNNLTFYRASLSSFLIIAVGAVIYFIYTQYFHISNWTSLILNGGLVFLTLSGISYLLLLKKEREILFETIINRKR